MMADGAAGAGRGFLRKGARYLAASLGPTYSAGAQFLLWIVLLHRLDPREFGAFSLLLIASQLSAALWSALFCAPLPILFHEGDADRREALLVTLFSTNLLLAGVGIAGFWLMAAALGVSALAALLFALFAAVGLLRWFARAHAYVEAAPVRTIASDNLYATVLLGGVGLITLSAGPYLTMAFGSMLAAVVLGLAPFGRATFARQFSGFSLRSVRSYGEVWRRHSAWSLVGVVTVEATANAHAYLVTGVLGPAAFAPLAASALLTRPIAVALNALAEYERAQMARHLRDRRVDLARAAMRHFQFTMVGVWFLVLLAGVALLMLAPKTLIPDGYDVRLMLSASMLWLLIALVRLWRTPVSTMLQAGGGFRPLAVASFYSAGVSISAVLGLLLWQGALWSLLGVLVGELAFAVLANRAWRGWFAKNQPSVVRE